MNVSMNKYNNNNIIKKSLKKVTYQLQKSISKKVIMKMKK